MNTEFKRKCRGTFDRTTLAGLEIDPQHKELVAGTIEKVEILSDRFSVLKWGKCCSFIFIALTIFFVIAGAIGIAVTISQEGSFNKILNSRMYHDKTTNGYKRMDGRMQPRDRDHFEHKRPSAEVAPIAPGQLMDAPPSIPVEVPQADQEPVPSPPTDEKRPSGEEHGNKPSHPKRDWTNGGKPPCKFRRMKHNGRLKSSHDKYRHMKRNKEFLPPFIKAALHKMKERVEKMNRHSLSADKFPLLHSSNSSELAPSPADSTVNDEAVQQRDHDVLVADQLLRQERTKMLHMFIKTLKKSQHHGKGCGILALWFVSMICTFVYMVKKRNLKKRIDNFLTLENRTIFRNLGLIWTIDKNLTALTLSTTVVQAPSPYPHHPQHAHPQQVHPQQVHPHHVHAHQVYTQVHNADTSVMMSLPDEE